MNKNPMFNYKCPNGFPPDECGHIPQLILNAVSYFQNKQQIRKENTEIQAHASLEQTNNCADGAQEQHKQRRRG